MTNNYTSQNAKSAKADKLNFEKHKEISNQLQCSIFSDEIGLCFKRPWKVKE